MRSGRRTRWPATNRGGPDDMLGVTNLGWCLEAGIGVPADPRQAVVLYAQAAARDYMPALTNLGYCYAHGIGVARDDSKAVECFRKGAEKRLSQGPVPAGEAYSRGLGVEQSDEEAARWYQSAAWLGYPAAQTELGRCLEFGTGLPQSIEQAVKWYRAAAENGNAPGQCRLGFLYESGQAWSRTGGGGAVVPRYCGAGLSPGLATWLGAMSIARAWSRTTRRRLAVSRAWSRTIPRGQLCMGFCCERGRVSCWIRRPRIGTGRRRAGGRGRPVPLGFLYESGQGWSRAGRRRCGGTVPPRNRACPVPSAIWHGAMNTARASPRIGESYRLYRKAAEQGMPEDFLRGPSLLTMAAV